MRRALREAEGLQLAVEEGAPAEDGLPRLGRVVLSRGEPPVRRMRAAMVVVLKGFVSTSLYASEMSSVMNGGEAMLRTMEHFGANVRGLRGIWSGRGSNIDEINRLTGLDQSIEEAAWKTWTGQQARSYGFTRVRLEAPPLGTPGNYERVNVVFE